MEMEMVAHIRDELAETEEERLGIAPSDIRMIMAPLMLILFISTLDQTIVATTLNDIQPLARQPRPRLLGGHGLSPDQRSNDADIRQARRHLCGRKSIFQFSVAIFVVGSALYSFAPNMLSLIIFRALQGIGGGGLNSLVMAIIGDLVPARERPRYQAMLGIVPAIAIVFGPVLGGCIVDYLSGPGSS